MRLLATNKPAYQAIFWIALGVLVLVIAKILTNDPSVGTIIVTIPLISVFLTNSRRIWLWLTILIVFSTNIFGIFSGISLPHVSMPGLGTLHISDILLILATIFAAYRRYLFRTNTEHFTPLSRPLFILLILVVLEALCNLAGGLDIHPLLNGLRTVAYYLLFFIVMSEIRKPEQLRQFLVGLLLVALITSAVSYVQVLFGISLSGSKVGMMSNFGLYRSYQAGGCLINSAFLVLLAILYSGIAKGLRWTIIGWLAVIVLLGAIIVTFARSTWGTILVAVMLVVLLSRRFALKPFLIGVFFLLVLFFSFNQVFESFAGKGFDVLTIRAKTGVEDFRARSGSFGNRLDFIALKWKAISQESPIIGRGFDWGSKYLNVNWNPYSRTADSGLASLFVTFGYSGIVLFIWIFATVFQQTFVLIRKIKPCLERSLVIGIAAFNVQLLMESFFGDRYTWPPAVAILATSWAVVALIGRFYEKKRLETQPVGSIR